MASNLRLSIMSKRGNIGTEQDDGIKTKVFNLTYRMSQWKNEHTSKKAIDGLLLQSMLFNRKLTLSSLVSVGYQVTAIKSLICRFYQRHRGSVPHAIKASMQQLS